MLGSYCGEEFVALLPNTEPWQAFRVAERIRNAIAIEPVNNRERMNHRAITVSIGIVALSSEANSLDKVIEAADAAMYRAKQKRQKPYFNQHQPDGCSNALVLDLSIDHLSTLYFAYFFLPVG